MPLLHLVILALVQGITEFLPISSSGHLVVVHELLGSASAQEDRILDIAVHIGTLLAVLLYFRRDFLAMASGALTKNTEGRRLLCTVVIGSLPVIAIGFFIHRLDPSWFYSLHVLAWCTLIFGIVLWWADRKPQDREFSTLCWKQALLIGASQVLALVPGTSRAGITMTTARWLGFSRTDAARFSLLLGMVAISGAGVLGGFDLLRQESIALTNSVLIAVGLAFISGYVTIALMMRWLENASFMPFAIYRIALGALMLILLYSGILA